MSVFSRQVGSVHDPESGEASAPSSSAGPRRSLQPVGRESWLTLGGLVYIAVTVFLAIGAINSQNNLLFWLFGVAIATLIVSGLFSGNALMKLRLEAQSINDCYAGEPVRLKYTIRNRSRFFPLFAAMITESPADPRVWARIEPAAALHLGPGRSGAAHALLIPARRGRHTLRTIRLSTRFPFGLLQKSLVFEQPRTVLVLPAPLSVKPDLVRTRRGRGEEVRQRSGSSGASSEYWGLREYRPGDAQRAIAWKPSARRSALVVVEHAQPVSTRLWIWIAGSRDEHDDPVAQERAIALAAALVRKGSERGLPVGLWMPAFGLRIASATGRAHAGRCLRALAMVDLTREPGPDAPPPASNRDDVLAITRDAHPLLAGPSVRTISVHTPGQWLTDPDLLPEVLRGSP